LSVPYVNRSPSGTTIPSRNPERRPTTAGPPPRFDGATPRGGATRFPLSDPVLNEVLNGRSVMEHLSAFQITDEELDISRRVIKGELNLEAAWTSFRRCSGGCRRAVAHQGDQPADTPSKQVFLLFLLTCLHVFTSMPDLSTCLTSLLLTACYPFELPMLHYR
jgi:hypothetical protein